MREKTSLLIVEDNDIDFEVVRRLLRKLSLDLPIVRARNGEEALAILLLRGGDRRLAPPFVVLIDINMPRMSGFELLDELADDDALADVPVFILSTSSNPKDQAQAEIRNVDGYVVKPIVKEELLMILDAVEMKRNGMPTPKPGTPPS